MIIKLLTKGQAASILGVGEGTLKEYKNLVYEGQKITSESVKQELHDFIFRNRNKFYIFNMCSHQPDFWREAEFVDQDDAEMAAKALAEHHKNPFMIFTVTDSEFNPVCAYECYSHNNKVVKVKQSEINSPRDYINITLEGIRK